MSTSSASSGDPATSHARAVELFERLGHTVVLDVETTTFSPDEGRVLEFAAVSFTGAHFGAIFSTPLRGVYEPKAGMFKNAVPVEIIPTAPDFRDIVPIVKPMIEGADLVVGQNVQFDLRWISAECKRAEVEIEFPDAIDTIAVGKAAFPGLASYNLDSLAAAAKVEVQHPRHRALADALTEHAVLIAGFEELYRTGRIRTAMDFRAQFAKQIVPKKAVSAEDEIAPAELKVIVDKLGRMVAAREATDYLVGQLEKGLLDHADQEGTKVIRGEEFFARASGYDVWEPLSKDKETESTIRAILTDAGLWDALSELNGFHLARAIAQGLIPESVASKLKEFGAAKHVRRIRIHPAH